jgi:hypothetical protein
MAVGAEMDPRRDRPERSLLAVPMTGTPSRIIPPATDRTTGILCRIHTDSGHCCRSCWLIFDHWQLGHIHALRPAHPRAAPQCVGFASLTQRISVALLEKAPSDLNLRSITGDRQRAQFATGHLGQIARKALRHTVRPDRRRAPVCEGPDHTALRSAYQARVQGRRPPLTGAAGCHGAAARASRKLGLKCLISLNPAPIWGRQ